MSQGERVEQKIVLHKGERRCFSVHLMYVSYIFSLVCAHFSPWRRNGQTNDLVKNNDIRLMTGLL